MATTTTYGFTKPTVGGDEDTWGTSLNGNWDDVDDLFDGTTVVTGIKIDDTASIVDNLDNTKVVQFQVSGVTTGTTRTFTFPDASGTFMLTSAIGSTVQAYDAGLASIAGLTTAADRMIYTTGSDTYAVATLTSAGRALLDDADASAQRTTLGLGNIATTDLIDEDDMASDTAAQAPTQQSVKAYVDTSVSGISAIGVGQTWQDVSGSRSVDTTYQNTTGKPIMVAIGGSWDGADATPFEVSANGSTWIGISTLHSGGTSNCSAIVPDDHYYRWTGGAPSVWAELR